MVCMHVCMHVSMYVCIMVCIYVHNMYNYIYIYAYVYNIHISLQPGMRLSPLTSDYLSRRLNHVETRSSCENAGMTPRVARLDRCMADSPYIPIVVDSSIFSFISVRFENYVYLSFQLSYSSLKTAIIPPLFTYHSYHVIN